MVPLVEIRVGLREVRDGLVDFVIFAADDAGAPAVTEARARKADLIDARADGERSFVASNVLRSAAVLERARAD